MTIYNTFDADSAKHFNRRPGGSRHHAYQDAQGNVCLWCRGRSPRGGAAVSLKGLAWLRTMDGEKFVRVSNSNGEMDEIVPLEELPEKEPRDGHGGAYIFIDLEDLTGPKFTPIGDDVPF